MQFKIKPILILFLVAAVFAIGTFLYINFRINKEMAKIWVRPSAADMKIENARYTETKHGRKEWELEAASAQYYKSNNLTVFDNIRVVFYSNNGIHYILEGREGRLRNDIKDMDIVGDVVVTSEDGYQLKTDSLTYRAAMRQISTKDRVIFTGPNMKIEGIGFLADMVTERIFILANVRTILKDVAI